MFIYPNHVYVGRYRKQQAWLLFSEPMWTQAMGWGTDLLEIDVQWRACWASYWAVQGEKTMAHLEASCLSSSYLIPPAPVPQVLPEAHPEHRREKELRS